MDAVIKRLILPPGRRILAISDVHGNYEYLCGLLKKAEFTADDILILVGDVLEKGSRSLDTLRYVMALSETHTVHTLCGNCDNWHHFIDHPTSETDAAMKNYLLTSGRGWGPGLVAQMCAEAGIDISEDLDVSFLRSALQSRFKPELDFLRSLPTVIDTEHYTFVHGGLPDGEMKCTEAERYMKNDSYMTQGHKLHKWLIVGHWPVVLYGERITCANPLIDRDSRIVSIDGGCVLKDDGQLNALVIPFDGSEDFSHIYYDCFPRFRALDDQTASDTSAYIRWGDNRVEVLSAGDEFSLCRHCRTGYTMDILTKYLYENETGVTCNDCTDYHLPVSDGDVLSVVEKTSRGYLAKKDGVSGWYTGRLEKMD